MTHTVSEDAELLRRYVEERSEEAFTELVGRYLNLIYQAASRRTGGRSDLAEEIAQEVFVLLARQAPKLVRHPVLAGWLYTTARYVTKHRLRTERRRLVLEQEAHMRNHLNEPAPTASWEQLHRELDGVMDQLPTRDREAILLRFFHGQAFAQIGLAFGLSEDAARKRVDRALECLREGLVKRGVTSTAVALATLLSSNSAAAAPAGLGQTIAVSALAHAATSSLPAASLIHFMNTKLTLNGLGALSLAVILGIASVGVANHEVNERQNATAEFETAQKTIETENVRLGLLTKQGQEADQRVTKLQTEIEQVRSVLAAKPNSPAPSAPPANRNAPLSPSEKEDFFARYGQARVMLKELGEAQIAANLVPFFQSAHLTPEQISEFKTRTVQLWLDHIAITPNSITPTVTQLPDADLREILGDENFQRFQDYNLVGPAYGVTEWVRLAVGYTALPLSDAQANQLVQSIIDHSNAAQPGSKLDLKTIDWNAVLAQAQGTLTPEQFKAAQPVLMSSLYGQALDRAQSGANAAASKPKS